MAVNELNSMLEADRRKLAVTVEEQRKQKQTSFRQTEVCGQLLFMFDPELQLAEMNRSLYFVCQVFHDIK